MKFLRKNDSVPINDYIDIVVLNALPPHHQKIIQKLLSSESNHMDKFFNKLSTNEIYLNHDMLFKILESLLIQMTLPLQVIEEPQSINHLDSLFQEPFNSEVHDTWGWLDFLDKLRIWSHAEAMLMKPYLTLAHRYIIQNEFPLFNQEKKTPNYQRFFKKTNVHHLSTEVLFKYIFEKIKFFHYDTLPHSKRPIDLFELFCPIEDAALEHRIIVLNDKQTLFFRSLNASALIFTAMHSFPYVLPDLVAEDLTLHPEFNFKTSHLQHQGFLPLFGQHPHLSNLNDYAFYLGLKYYFNDCMKIKKTHISTIDFIYQALHDPKINQDAEIYFQNLTSRLVFIFNRLTTLGFLLRSPLLKGLGYHPLINSDVPQRMAQNFPIFLQYFLKLDESDKMACLKPFSLIENKEDLPQKTFKH